MQPERWSRLEQLLDAALDLPLSEREAFLVQECVDEPDLAREALAILEAGERFDPVLDTPADRFGAPLILYEPGKPPSLPERIGPYRIERLIGEGGMGTVYLAHRDDGEFDQRVALKLVRRGLHLDARVVRRFREERKILASLNHPAIARLLDGGLTEEDLPWFAMEYVEGLPADRYCQARALSVEERLELFARICDAVAHAHGKQIVHRDIKPSNILVSEAGDPRLLDFGIAKLLETEPGDTELTRRSERLLTPEYASPEQIRGEPVGMASDVYCLGVLLYELLTGKRPFVHSKRTTHELERAVLEDDPTRPSDAVPQEPLRRRLRGDLDAIVFTAMRKEPAERYPSAAELGADVRRHLRGEPVTARGTGRIYRLRRWARRHRVGLGSSAAGVVLGAGIIALVAMRWDRAPGDPLLRALRLSQPQHVTTEEGIELDPALSPDGAQVAYAGGIENSMRILVRRRDGGRPVVLSGGLAGSHRRPQWSPDGTSLLFMAEGGIWLVPAVGGTPRSVIAAPVGDSAGIAHSPAWSPDGRRLAWIIGDSIYVRALDGGPARRLATVAVAHSLAWSPDGRWIAVVSDNYEFVYSRLGNLGPSALYLLPAECEATSSSCQPVLLTPPASLNLSPVWLDRSRLVFVSNRGGSRDLFAMRIGSRGAVDEPVRLTAGQDVFGVSAAANGRLLAYSVYRQSSNIWSLDISAGQPRRLADAIRVTAGQQTVEGVALSPDGQWLAYDANPAGQQDIYVMPATGGEPERVIATPDDDFHPNWSPDGRWIAFYSFSDGVRRGAVAPARGGPIRLLHPDGPLLEEHTPIWTPDGTGLVYFRNFSYGSQLFLVRRTSDSTWSPERQITRHGGVAISFSADGRRTAYIGPVPGSISLMGAELDDRSSRVVYSSPGPDSLRIETGLITRDGGAFIAKGEDRTSPGFWRVPLDGGAPRLLVRLNDPRRTAPRPEFATDGQRLFFVLTEREADVWVVRLEER